jgi:hypothetical protein
LTRNDVTRAFAAAGVQLTYGGEVAGVHEYTAPPFASLKTSWLEVEIFPTERPARDVQRIGGNLEGADGRLIHPFAVIRNVVITLFKAATRGERARVSQAARQLRRQRR